MAEQYLPRFFIIEEGQRAFHERVHYWQHVGSTFGAFQILGFQITSKAMRITIRDLSTLGLMVVPLRGYTLERLIEKTNSRAGRMVSNFLGLLERFEVTKLIKPIHLNGLDAKKFHVGWHEQQPLLKIKTVWESRLVPLM